MRIYSTDASQNNPRSNSFTGLALRRDSWPPVAPVLPKWDLIKCWLNEDQLSPYAHKIYPKQDFKEKQKTYSSMYMSDEVMRFRNYRSCA